MTNERESAILVRARPLRPLGSAPKPRSRPHTRPRIPILWNNGKSESKHCRRIGLRDKVSHSSPMPCALLTTVSPTRARGHRLAAAQQRTRRRALGFILVLLATLALSACFDADALRYAPCRSSEACQDAGLVACVVRPTIPNDVGFCAPACSSPCPTAVDGDAPARCLDIDGESLCVLECDPDITCPLGQECVEVEIDDNAGERSGLCFPRREARP